MESRNEGRGEERGGEGGRERERRGRRRKENRPCRSHSPEDGVIRHLAEVAAHDGTIDNGGVQVRFRALDPVWNEATSSCTAIRPLRWS